MSKGVHCLAGLAEVGVGGRYQSYQLVPAHAPLMLMFMLAVSAEAEEITLNSKLQLFCCTFAPCIVNAQPVKNSYLGTK